MFSKRKLEKLGFLGGRWWKCHSPASDLSCRSLGVDLWAQSSLLVWGKQWNSTNNSNMGLITWTWRREGNAAEGAALSSSLAPQLQCCSPLSPELFYTERAHVRTLKVLHNVFYQRVTREGILSSSDKRKIFSNLEDILGLHGRSSWVLQFWLPWLKNWN